MYGKCCQKPIFTCVVSGKWPQILPRAASKGALQIFWQDGPKAFPQELLSLHNYSHLCASSQRQALCVERVSRGGCSVKGSSKSLQRQSVMWHLSSTYCASRGCLKPGSPVGPESRPCSAPRGPQLAPRTPLSKGDCQEPRAASSHCSSHEVKELKRIMTETKSVNVTRDMFLKEWLKTNE